jgi:hypothetical protein
VQRLVDRRFDHARYDAELTADAFGERVWNPEGLGSAPADLVETIERTFAPSHLSRSTRPG